jgi:hypothetical protein
MPGASGSAPPPTSGGGGRTLTIELESGRRRGPLDALRLSPQGAVLEVDALLRAPLRLPLGRLQIGLVDRGAARASGPIGRFPVLRRLSPTAVLPREEGIEGWLWTSLGGSALAVLGEEDEAPTGALLFTSPLGRDVLDEAMRPDALAALAAHSPLGEPAILGVLFRCADPGRAETAFRAYGLLRPLTDREVPPTMRRALPTDKAPDPIAIRGGDGPSGSVAPPGF